MEITVIITSYNQKHYLKEAIESVLQQTLQPKEIIIVDDSSTDGSQTLIKGYAEQYPKLIRAFCHRQNMGIPRNKNFALDQAQGDSVVFLDGDDRFLPNKLELEQETFEMHPQAGLVFSNFYYIDDRGQRTGLWLDQTSPPTGNVFVECFARHWPRNSLYRNELMKLDVLREIGYFDENLSIWEDWDLRIRFTKRFEVAYCSYPLTEYRLHRKGISKVSDAKIHLQTKRYIIEKNRHLLDDLSRLDRDIVERALDVQITFTKAKSLMKSGDRLLAINLLLLCAWKNPLQILVLWKRILRLIMPSTVFNLAKQIYR